MAASGLILDPRRSSRKDLQGLGRYGVAAPRRRRGSVPAARRGGEVGLWWRLRDGVLGSRGCGLGCLKGAPGFWACVPRERRGEIPGGDRGLPLRARGEGKGMTPTHGPGQAVRESDAGRGEARASAGPGGQRARATLSRAEAAGRAARWARLGVGRTGPRGKLGPLRGKGCWAEEKGGERSGPPGFAGPSGERKRRWRAGPLRVLGWVLGLVFFEFWFSFSISNSNHTQIIKTMHQHECNTKI